MLVSETSRARGTQSENEAVHWYLTTYSARLLTRNYFCKAGEIDLIFLDRVGEKLELAFVEVKYRKKDSLVRATDCLSLEKRRRLWRAIQHFLAHYRGEAVSLRVDLLAQDGASWTHFRDIRLF